MVCEIIAKLFLAITGFSAAQRFRIFNEQNEPILNALESKNSAQQIFDIRMRNFRS